MGIPEWIKAFFSKAVRMFKQLLKEAIPLLAQIIIGQLSKYAEQVIGDLNSTDLRNDEKRGMAFDKIKDYSVKNGLEVRDSLINLIIELVVLKFKEW